ncbi:hypothetical protein EDM56_09785 [Brevibacillus fluminis]|uniref:Cadherin domain-containing protein n=1 Tax=Brevibacillus fluminis TaxID=511487 RepID=A0A3M8DN09_9BACL|nr:Ig-like domain-containing protein [Brevibacillus fluminis]RNB89480.1 hypothetical protein EDM56_09785 [Brevibacillus fluminis]
MWRIWIRLLVLVMFFSVWQTVGIGSRVHAALQTAKVPVTADTFIDLTGKYPNGTDWNGLHNILFVGYEWDGEDYGAANAALKFDLSNIHGKIQSAELKIHIVVQGQTGDNPYVDVYGSNDDGWVETTNNLPTLSQQVSPRVTFITSVLNKEVSFPVTSYVQEQASGDKVATFVLKGIQTKKPGDTLYNPQIGFYDKTSETNGDLAAYLDITYDPNAAPTDLNLSMDTVAENSPTSTTVGTLSATDPNAGDTFAYTIVGGDTDSFAISGNALKTTKVFDYETKKDYSVTLRVTDSGGLYYEKSIAIHVANVKPTITFAVNGGAQFANQANVTLNLISAPPENVGLQMRFSNDNANWSSWETFATTKPWTLTTGDGTKTVYVEVKDSVDTVMASDLIGLDTTKPTATLLINGGVASTKTAGVTLTISASDAGGGSVEMRLANEDGIWSGWGPIEPSKPWSLSAGDGSKTVSLQVRDLAGNQQQVDKTVALDTAAPIVTGVSNGQMANDDVTIAFNEGIATLNGTVFLSGEKVSAEGSYTLIVTDTAGNMTTIAFTIDRTPPNGTISIENGATNVKDKKVSLYLTTDDAKQMRFSNNNTDWSSWETAANRKDNWLLTDGDGTKTVYMELRDQAGNVKSVSDTVVLDTTAPTGTVTINEGATHSSSQSVTLGITSDGAFDMRVSNTSNDSDYSAWESVKGEKAWDLAASDGTKTVYVQLRDEAGNTTDLTASIVLDTTAPVVTGVAQNGLYNDNLVITFGSDETASLDGGPFANNGTVSTEGEHSLIVTDKAGNTTTINFRLDKTAPVGTLVINDGKSYTNSASVKLTIGKDDATEMRISNDTTWDESWEPAATGKLSWALGGGNGSKTVYLQLRDQAGNTSITNASIELDTVAPVVTGVDEAGLYNDDVTITFNEGTATLDGDAFSIGQKVSEEGEHTLIVTDPAENTTTRHFTIDKTAPTGTLVINGGKSVTNNKAVTLSVTMAVDTKTIYLSNDQTNWTEKPAAAGEINWNVSDGDGPKTVYLKLVDKAGNEAVVQAAIELDTKAPTGTIAINGGTAYANNKDVTLSITSNDAAEMRISNDNSAWTDWETVGSTKAWTLTDGDGVKTVYIQLRDQANNQETVSDTITLDTNFPVVSGVTDGGLYNADVTVAFNEGTATLNGQPFLSGTKVTEEGEHKLIVTDEAGNKTTITFTVDKTAPAGTFTINEGAPYTNKADVKLHTNTNGAAEMRFSNDGTVWSVWETVANEFDWTLTAGDGDKTVYMQLRDQVGNVHDEQQTITLDTVEPAVTLTLNSGEAFTNKAEVQAGLTASDASGAALEMRFSNDGTTWKAWETFAPIHAWTLDDGDGFKTVYVEVRDAAGNTKAVQATITLDTKAPVVSDLTDGAHYNTDQTITFDDGQAELDGTPIANGATVTDEGVHTLVVTDDAGNMTRIRFTLDKTAPTGSIQINNGDAQTRSRQVKLSLITDDNIGPVDMRFSNDGSAWSDWEDAASTKNWTLTSGDGEKTVYVQLQDQAGNTADLSDNIRLNTYVPPVYVPVTSVSLDQTKLKLMVGDSPVSLHASIEPSNASNQDVRWSSSNPEVASVNGAGLVTPLQAGKATIIVTTVDGNKTASSQVTVEKKEDEETRLEASEDAIRVQPKKTATFRVYAVSGDERKDITRDENTSYQTDSELITVTPGRIKAGSKPGKAVITVRYAGQELEIPVTVSNAKLSKLEPSATTAVLEPDEEQQLSVRAVYEDKSSEDVTEDAEWTTDDTDVVEVTKDGQVKAVGTGKAVVKVTFGGKKAEIKVLVVKSKQPTKLEADHTSIRIKPGETYEPVITAYYEKGYSEVIDPKEITWNSRNERVVTVEDGQIKAVAAGKTTVSVSYKGKRLTLSVTVKK